MLTPEFGLFSACRVVLKEYLLRNKIRLCGQWCL